MMRFRYSLSHLSAHGLGGQLLANSSEVSDNDNTALLALQPGKVLALLSGSTSTLAYAELTELRLAANTESLENIWTFEARWLLCSEAITPNGQAMLLNDTGIQQAIQQAFDARASESTAFYVQGNYCGDFSGLSGLSVIEPTESLHQQRLAVLKEMIWAYGAQGVNTLVLDPTGCLVPDPAMSILPVGASGQPSKLSLQQLGVGPFLQGISQTLPPALQKDALRLLSRQMPVKTETSAPEFTGFRHFLRPARYEETPAKATLLQLLQDLAQANIFADEPEECLSFTAISQTPVTIAYLNGIDLPWRSLVYQALWRQVLQTTESRHQHGLQLALALIQPDGFLPEALQEDLFKQTAALGVPVLCVPLNCSSKMAWGSLASNRLTYRSHQQQWQWQGLATAQFPVRLPPIHLPMVFSPSTMESTSVPASTPAPVLTEDLAVLAENLVLAPVVPETTREYVTEKTTAVPDEPVASKPVARKHVLPPEPGFLSEYHAELDQAMLSPSDIHAIIHDALPQPENSVPETEEAFWDSFDFALEPEAQDALQETLRQSSIVQEPPPNTDTDTQTTLNRFGALFEEAPPSFSEVSGASRASVSTSVSSAPLSVAAPEKPLAVYTPIDTENPPIKQDFEPGDRVVHSQYGEGVVERVLPMENRVTLKIKFAQVGKRLLDAQSGQLKKL